MFRNFIKTAFRNIVKSKFYSSLNIVGLAVGLATCLLIVLYVIDELSYDRWNKKADRIYRLVEGRAREYDGTADADSGLV